MRKTIILLGAIIMSLSIVACSNKISTDNGDISDKKVADIKTTEPSMEGSIKTPLGDFSAQDFDGNTVENDIFSDYDLTMINLWTTSCGYCIEEMPILDELRKELQDEGKSFNIISICMNVGNTEEITDESLKKAKEIINKTGINYKNLIPDKVLLEGRLKGIQAFPESFFVDKEGNVVSQPYVGALSKNHWRVTIDNEIDKFNKSIDKE